MNKRLFILCLLALAATLAWWHWSPAQSGAVSTPTAASPPATTVAGSPENTKTTATSVSAPASAAPDFGKPGLKEQLQNVMKSANRPISFFGKVVDQDGNPISDVNETFEIRYTKEVGPAGIGDTFDYPSVKTGPDGRFALNDAKGAVLAVKSLEKPGYEPSEQATRGVYWYRRDKDPYRPDSDNPKVIHMWKKSGAEKLVKQQKMTRIPYDGTTTTFDLNGAKLGRIIVDLRGE